MTFPKEIKRGDLVHINIYDLDRDIERLIWDGQNLLNLDTEMNDYGSIPKEFPIGDEFLPNHWNMAHPRNYHVWVNANKYWEDIEYNLEQEEKFYRSYFIGELGRIDIIFLTKDDVDEFLANQDMDKIMFQIGGESSYTLNISDPRTIFYVSYN